MATAAQQPNSSVSNQPARPHVELKVSAFEQVSSLLMTLILFVGIFVLVMFLIWLTTVLVFTPKSVAVTLVENPAGRGDHAEGFARDLEPPGAEEVEEISEPTIEETLEAVTETITTIAASLNAINTGQRSTTQGDGQGDSRPPGPLGEGDDIIPRWERWEIHYSSSNISEYSKQLDFFNLELCAVGGGRSLADYAKRFSKGAIQKRSGTSADEKRIYMTWTSGAMRRFDRQLLGRAGVPTGGRIILQFYPPATENMLAVKELEYAQRARNITSVAYIQKTVFAVLPAGSGYEYQVIEQRYRVPRKV